LSGLLADDDPRFLATVLAIEAELRSGPTIYRYKWDDGLPGREGGFHICAAWMIEAFVRTGRRADAEELFEQMLNCTGPTGLLPEQYGPETSADWATIRRRTAMSGSSALNSPRFLGGGVTWRRSAPVPR
jgi:pentatricopeptide repeat protein